jgi:hypothetical protein
LEDLKVVNLGERVDSVEAASLSETLKGKDTVVLVALLDEYGQRWKHSATQIWSISVIFIPLSLSGVAVDLGDRERTLGIAFFSSALIWIWYWLSQSIRSRYDQDWAVYAAIESTLLGLDPPRLNRGLVEFVPRIGYTFSVRRLRLLIAMTVTVAWILFVILMLVKG